MSSRSLTSPSEDAPLSIGLVFDTSGSMGNKLGKSRQAVAQFSRPLIPRTNSFSSSSTTARADPGFPPPNLEEIQNKLTFTQAKGALPWLDAVSAWLSQDEEGPQPAQSPALISDGGDNSSRYTESEIKKSSREADVRSTPSEFSSRSCREGRSAEELAAPGLLSELSEQTGGRPLRRENRNELPDVAARSASSCATSTSSILPR